MAALWRHKSSSGPFALSSNRGDSRPAAADEAAAPTLPESSTTTRSPERASSRARLQPMMPAPIIKVSEFSILAGKLMQIYSRRDLTSRERLLDLGKGPDVYSHARLRSLVPWSIP